MNNELKLVTGIIIGFVMLVALFVLNPFTQVEAGERGVVLNWGAFNGQIMEPGLHFRTPLVQSVVKMDVQTQKLEIENSEAYSHDLQNVKIHSVANYNPDPKSVGTIYQQFGNDYEARVLKPSLEAAVKQTIAKYTAEEILSKRSEVQTEIENTFRSSVPALFTVTHYAMVDEEFSPAFEAAIEAKQVAQQNAEKAENELKKTKVDAEARVAQAQAEAEAIKVQSEAANNDKYINLKALDVQMEAAKRWNGVLPTTMLPGASLPFIQIPSAK